MPISQDVYIYNNRTASMLRFITFLKKYFDVEVGAGYKTIFCYEHNNDCEPVFILHEPSEFIEFEKSNYWVVGNIYSKLEHGKKYSEKELRKIIKSEEVI